MNTMGGYHDTCGEYHEYRGECSVPLGGGGNLLLCEYLHGTEHPPRCYDNLPHVSW